MKIFHLLLFISFVTVLISCNPKKVESAHVEDPDWQDVELLMPLSHQLKKSVNDLVVVSTDTLVAALWEGNIVKSIDGGKTWTEYPTTYPIRDLTIDEDKRIWGLSASRGEHVSGSSLMFYSDDFGESWALIDFDIRKFFPSHFLTEPRKRAELVTFYDGSYRYVSGHPKEKNSWEKFDSLSERDTKFHSRNVEKGSAFDILGDSILIKRDTLKNTWKKVISMKKHRQSIYDILQDSTAVFIAGNEYISADIEQQALLAVIQLDGKIKKYNIDGVVVNGVKRSDDGKIWAFGDKGIYLIRTSVK